MIIYLLVLVVTAESCTPTQVANSDKSGAGSITGETGDTVAVVCAEGYSGGGTVTCQTDNTFSTVTCDGEASHSIAMV